MQTLGNWFILIAGSALAVIGVGLWARLITLLFCIGYGC